MDFQQWLRSTLARLNFSNLPRAEHDIRQLVEKIQFTFSSSPFPPSALQILKIGYGQTVLSMQGALNTSPPFPITLYIRPDYPLFPPIAFYTGRLQGPHPHIDGSGFVFHPAINQWNPSSSSLFSLVSDLGFTFSSQNPALPRPQQVSPPQPLHHHHHHQPQIAQPPPPQPQTQTQTQTQTQMQQNTIRMGASGGVPYGFPYQALPSQGPPSQPPQPYQPPPSQSYQTPPSQSYQPMASQGQGGQGMMAKAPSTGSLPSSTSSSSSSTISSASTRSMPTSISSTNTNTNTNTISASSFINPFSPSNPIPSSSGSTSSTSSSVSSSGPSGSGPGKEMPPVPQRSERLAMGMQISGRLSGILEEKMRGYSSMALPPSSPPPALPSLHDLDQQIHDLQIALARESAAISSVESFDLDRHTDWPDPHSRQLSGLMADDLTIEDAMYELALFHRQGALSLDSLTKLVRTLSNDQFMVRATRAKMSETRSIPS